MCNFCGVVNRKDVLQELKSQNLHYPDKMVILFPHHYIQRNQGIAPYSVNKLHSVSPVATLLPLLSCHKKKFYLSFPFSSILRNLGPETSANTFICEIAILFNRNRRSRCGIPSVINTALRLSILERHISSLMEA